MSQQWVSGACSEVRRTRSSVSGPGVKCTVDSQTVFASFSSASFLVHIGSSSFLLSFFLVSQVGTPWSCGDVLCRIIVLLKLVCFHVLNRQTHIQGAELLLIAILQLFSCYFSCDIRVLCFCSLLKAAISAVLSSSARLNIEFRCSLDSS